MSQETSTQSIAQSKKNIDKILFIIVSALSVLLPIFIIPFVPVAGMSKIILYTFISVALIIVLVVTYLRDGKVALPKSSVIGALGFVVLVMGLSAVVSGKTNTGFIGTLDTDTVLFYFVSLILIYVMPLAVNTKTRAYKIVLLFIGSVIFAGFIQILRLTITPDVLSFGIFADKSNNLIGSWNDTGILAGLALLIALLAYELIATTRASKIIASSVIGFSFLILLIVNSFIVWTVVGVGALIVFVYSFSNTIGRKRSGVSEEKMSYRVPLVPLLIVMLSVVCTLITMRTNPFGFVGSFSPFSFFNRYSLNVVEGRPSLSSTYQLGVSVLKEKHIFGAGPNNFEQVWNMYKKNEINQYPFWNSDFSYGYGVVPSSFVTLGILGVLAWLALLVTILWTGIRIVFKRYADKQNQFLIASAFAGTLYLWFFIITYTPGVTIIIAAFIMLGLMLAVKEQVPSAKGYKLINFITDPRMAFGFVLGLVVLLVGSVISVYWIGTVIIANAYKIQAIQYFSANNLDAAENSVSNSLRIKPTDSAYRVLTSIGLARATVLTQSNSGDATSLRTVLQNTLSIAGAAVALDRDNYENWIMLGQVYQFATSPDANDAYSEAVKAYAEAEKRNPSSPYISLLKSQLEQAHGNTDASRDFAIAAIAKKADYLDAYYFLTQILLNQGKTQDAIASAGAAVQASPTNSLSWFQLGVLYYSVKNYTNAAVAFERAVYFNPQFANARYFGGLAYDKLGRHDDAIKIFQVLKETNPDNKELDAIIANIKAGKPAIIEGTTVPALVSTSTSKTTTKTAPKPTIKTQAATTTAQ